jgi:hypothetical protein
VAVGTANFRDPLAGIRVRRELEAALSKRGAGSISDLGRRMAPSTST